MKFRLRNAMPTVELHSSAPPESVWDVLVDLDAWPQWGPTVAGAELAEPAPLRLGSKGKVRTPVGLSLPFTITEFHEGRSWAWDVAGVGATRHEVHPDVAGSRLAFGVPWWATAYLPVCVVALHRISRMATAR